MKITFSRNHAIQRVKNYNKQGIATSLSFLPVRSYSKDEIVNDITEYTALFDEIFRHNLNSDTTIKLLQFGISHNVDLVRESLAPLLASAKQKQVRMWFDQDLLPYVDKVISLAKENAPQNVGICLQAYRTRTEKDVEEVEGYPVRLVKGFYNDSDIHPWAEVTKNYSRLMDMIVEVSPYPCFATHDLQLVEKAKKILKGKDGEIQFFAGVRDALAAQLVQEGYKVRIYVPYGQVFQFAWYGLPEFDLPREVQRLLHFARIR